MALIAIVDGVKIFVYPNDHPPPHFHGLLAEHRVVVSIEKMRVMYGTLPKSKLHAVLAWAKPRRAELDTAWRLSQAGKLVDRFS